MYKKYYLTTLHFYFGIYISTYIKTLLYKLYKLYKLFKLIKIEFKIYITHIQII